MTWDLRGRAALITGGASGIGAELARRLTARGMRVGLIDVDGAGLERVAASLDGAHTHVADVREPDALAAAVDALATRLGGLDLAVANAGIATGGPLRLVGPETVEETIDVNLLGVWRTVRAALPHVLERRGHLLLVASAAAVLPSGGLGAYSAAKAGVEALGRSLRVELRAHGVTVGVAYYLFLNTPMVTAGEASPVFQTARRRMPGFIGRTRPVEPAVERTVAAIERRARSAVYPPFLRAVMLARGLLDSPLSDRIAAASIPEMEAAFAREAERIGPSAAARAVGR
ncbi:MAG TPA: short-chain dehydrogenase/reductase [Solirubrobacter sp.]|nr:short-chain dehydrogenase/reductase [Solirubrobacter sp.]